MNENLTLLIIVKNASETLERTLLAVKKLTDTIILVDNGSKDNTVMIAKTYGANVYVNKTKDLGKLRAFALSKVKTEWVLVLDADEVLSEGLMKEIKLVIKSSNIHSGFEIPFLNHFLGRPLKHGGEDYKLLRLFKRDAVKIDPSYLHEKFVLEKGTNGTLKEPILHYSYRNILQVLKKFTDYARRGAKEKAMAGEKVTLKKLFLHPIHMFWARYVEDRGYQDGLFRIPLDLAFAYMEFLTYLFLLLESSPLRTGGSNHKNFGPTVKIGFIVVLYKTEKRMLKDLVKEINPTSPGLRQGYDRQARLRGAGEVKDEIFIIDNTGKKRGYAGGVNEGLRKAINSECDVLVVMNPDISLKGMSRNTLLEGGKYFDIWGGTMMQDGKKHYEGKLDKWRLTTYFSFEKPEKRFIEADFVTGSLMIFGKNVIDKIGFWDEDYFMYYEDVDYSVRGRNAGLKAGIDTKLEYEHFESSKDNKKKDEWLEKSRKKFFWKYAGWRQKMYEVMRTLDIRP